MGDVTQRAIDWITGDDTGASSETLLAQMMGANGRDWPSHPYDPADLGRCLRLLDLIPEWKDRLPEMAGVSPQWAALIARWNDLEAMMREEVGIGWEKGKRAPATYKFMKMVLATPTLGGSND